jgi:S1-C subfamily serine protease
MKRNLWVITVLLVLAITVVGCKTQASSSSTAASNQSVTTTSTYPITVPPDLSGQETTFEPIYARVNPSVVLVRVVILQSSSNQEGKALGSGFVWDTQGDILTDSNLINGVSSITVTFTDGTVVDAHLVGIDADSDLAVIRVNPSGLKLQPVILGDSTNVKVGQLAMAIGNPFGLENTMSVGSISAIGPALTNTNYSIPGVLQLDTLCIRHYKRVPHLSKTADEKGTTWKKIPVCWERYSVAGGKDDSSGTERNYQNIIFYQTAQCAADCQRTRTLPEDDQESDCRCRSAAIPPHGWQTELGDGSVSGYNQNVA